jgi:hypothetical protein
MLRLQRTAGNRATIRAVGLYDSRPPVRSIARCGTHCSCPSCSLKNRHGEANERPFPESERISANQLRRAVLARKGEASVKPDANAAAPACSTCEAVPQMLARLETAAPEKVGELFGAHAVAVDGGWISRQIKHGTKLDPGVQREMEGVFGADFSGVRIHSGQGASRVARRLNAKAATIGTHVIFGEAAYSPNTKEGRRLLRHEHSHVVQQRDAAAIPAGLIRIAQPNEMSEREASTVADGASRAATSQSLSRVPEVQVNRTSLCEIGCDVASWGLSGAAVAYAASACAIGDFFTIGALTIPCIAAVTVAAGMGAAGAVILGAVCKQELCGIPITVHTPPQTSSAPPPAADPDPGTVSVPSFTRPADPDPETVSWP